jgi:hypothetical protein
MHITKRRVDKELNSQALMRANATITCAYDNRRAEADLGAMHNNVWLD